MLTSLRACWDDLLNVTESGAEHQDPSPYGPAFSPSCNQTLDITCFAYKGFRLPHEARGSFQPRQISATSTHLLQNDGQVEHESGGLLTALSLVLHTKHASREAYKNVQDRACAWSQYLETDHP